MNRHKSLILLLTLCILLSTQTQAQPETAAGANTETDVPTIAVTKLDITDKTLKLSYEIRNNSKQDVWILAGYDKTDVSASVFMDEDGRTLLIRTRLDVRSYVYADHFHGRYVRLCSGQTQTESVCLAIPVHPHRGIARRRHAQGLEYATRLAVEIGYYTGDLPAMIRGILVEADKTSDESRDVYPIYPTTIEQWFGGSLGFYGRNAGLRDRNEEVIIPYTQQALKGEHILRLTVDDLLIPYEEEEDRSDGYRHPPNLLACTRVDIKCQPSILEYFFPYAGQQSLLSDAEKQKLRSPTTVVVDDPERIRALVHDLSKGVSTSGIVRERSMAHLVCYRDGERLMSFTVYNDESIVNEGRYRFTYSVGLQSLRILTPQIKPLELRVRCATNLRDLWHRLRLYHKAEKKRLKDLSGKSAMVYPAPTKWCDDMVRAYRVTGMLDKFLVRPHICPSADHGKCHYAMNPNCKPDSPPDMVLLFETKSGWNQHGGPELFTFDNHEPRGGCVLLNDGTVKFIRTKEELQQLRWN